MPIKIPCDLPAAKTLQEENIFVIDIERAKRQDIRPLRVLILNLMPTKIATETQLARLLGNTPLQIEMELLTVSSRVPKHTAKEHMIAFYKSFGEVKDSFYDGLIITGAPVEQMPFEEVDYWQELCEIMEWSKSHVQSTFHICWGAQAGLRISLPKNYFPNDDDAAAPVCKWRAGANLLYSNWLNYFVYQSTPYSITQILENGKKSEI